MLFPYLIYFRHTYVWPSPWYQEIMNCRHYLTSSEAPQPYSATWRQLVQCCSLTAPLLSNATVIFHSHFTVSLLYGLANVSFLFSWLYSSTIVKRCGCLESWQAFELGYWLAGLPGRREMLPRDYNNSDGHAYNDNCTMGSQASDKRSSIHIYIEIDDVFWCKNSTDDL